MQEYEKAYSTKEISLTLEIGTSTLRKWCLALEKSGYNFHRTGREDNNKRLFVERDLVALKYFKKLVQGENFPLENAAKVIVSKYEQQATELGTPSVLPLNGVEQRSSKRSDDLIDQLIEKVDQQNQHIMNQEQFNKELLDRLDQQQKYINERLNAHEDRLIKRDELLMQSIRHSLETQKQLAVAKEKEITDEKKYGFWGRLFGK